MKRALILSLIASSAWAEIFYGSFDQITLIDSDPESAYEEKVYFSYNTATGKGALTGITGVFYENKIEFEVYSEGSSTIPASFEDLTDFDSIEWRVNRNVLDSQGTYDASGFSAYVPLCGGCGWWSGQVSSMTELTEQNEDTYSISVDRVSVLDGITHIYTTLKGMEVGAVYALEWNFDISDPFGWEELEEFMSASETQKWDSLTFSNFEYGRSEYFDTDNQTSIFIRIKKK